MLNDYEFWFVVGSQFLYGPEVLETVSARAAEMADALNASGNLPCKIVYKVTAKTNAEITDLVREANYNKRCAGLITWCHTFSPGKSPTAILPPSTTARSPTRGSTWIL